MSSGNPLYQNLDTTFVNLWSLLRRLTEQKFVGRVHVELNDYAADIFIDGSSTPLVREIDRTANTETVEAGALHRVVLRARETPGRISVFEGADGASVKQTAESVSQPHSPAAISAASTITTENTAVHIAEQMDDSSSAPRQPAAADAFDELVYRTGSYQDWPAILAVSGELIGAIERGVNASGGDFGSLFRSVRVELADDYTFLDPFTHALTYSAGALSLKTEPGVSVFVAGLSEALRRTVDRVAIGDRARRVRERMALELLPVARKHADALERSGFRAQLDRIAGTTVM